jgi:hypothetical protein
VLASYFEDLPGCVSLGELVLHTDVLIGCQYLVERLSGYAVVFFRVVSGLELLMAERRRQHVQDDDAGAAVPG